MKGVVRGWLLPLAIGSAILAGLTILASLTGLDPVVIGAASVAVAVLFPAAIWVAEGASVAGLLAMLGPALVAVSVLIWSPLPATRWVAYLVILWPLGGAVIEPVGRPYNWYIRRASQALAHAVLPRQDRRTLQALMTAIRSRPDELARMSELDLGETVRAINVWAEAVRAVPAPDLAWARVIRALADPLLVYRDMLAGRRTLDYDLVDRDVRDGHRMVRDLLRSRSTGYRILTHRFVTPKEAGRSTDLDIPSPGSAA
jgi:hypothetical protein